jgi:hypothetical protein
MKEEFLSRKTKHPEGPRSLHMEQNLEQMRQRLTLLLIIIVDQKCFIMLKKVVILDL